MMSKDRQIGWMISFCLVWEAAVLYFECLPSRLWICPCLDYHLGLSRRSCADQETLHQHLHLPEGRLG